MRPRLRTALFIACLALPVRGAAAEARLLLITIDTLRPDRLSCYSQKFLQTPEIDALAVRGAVFEWAFAHNPTTLPSHANILTGVTPIVHGVRENSKSKLPASCLTLAEHLRASGYATAAFIGAFPLDARFGLDQGFDVYNDSVPSKPARWGTYPERRAGAVVSAASEWLSGRTGKWFCWVHLFDPHAPYAPPEPFLSRFRDDPYSGEVAYVDAQLSALFADLRKEGQFEGTVIVLTADHGESLGEHGEMTHSYFAYNSTIHVPLIIVSPGVHPSRLSENVSHIDIFPTVCALLAIPAPENLQGRSLVGLMKGSARPEKPIYFESLEPYLNKSCAPLRGFVDGPTKYMDSPVPELYDLATDPAEAKNLADTRELGPLKKKLEALVASLASPLAAEASRIPDRGTLEKLLSLGYIASPIARLKGAYGPEDDLKNFLPYQQRLERAILMADRGDAEGGIREMTALASEKKGFAPAFVYLSQLYAAERRTAEAVRALEAGVAANPDDFSLLSSLGTLLVQTKQYDRAAEVLEKTLAIIDFDPAVWDNLGIVFMRKGNYPKALECLARAVALDGTFALAYSNIGAVRLEMYFKQGRKPEDLARAIENFRRAVALDPTLGLAFRALGAASLTAGNADEAMSAWEKAVALSPGDDYAIFQLGLLYLEKGEKSKALEKFENYLRIKGETILPEERTKVLALIGECRK
jgi:arylsulfatase A-like enzyme/Flp pilus assembly protein TadD